MFVSYLPEEKLSSLCKIKADKGVSDFIVCFHYLESLMYDWDHWE